MLSASAQTNDSTTITTTTSTHKYYYYPSSNVYFDESSGNYWYQDKKGSNWSMTKTLPTNITVEKTDRYPLDYSGTDPWKNNTADVKKYKERRNGTVKKEKQ
jgi:hypothetical protein